MRFSICVAISFFVVACAQQSTTQGPTPPQPVKCPGLTSPDQQLRACVLSVGKHPNPPFNESRVEIRNMKGMVLATKDFKSPDGEHGRNVQKREWSPDSQFFVFNVESTGGHQPGHLPVNFYSRRDHKLYLLEHFVGYITSQDFALKAPDVLKTRSQKLPGASEDVPLAVSLSRIVGRRHR